MIRFEDVTIDFGGPAVFSHVGFEIPEGDLCVVVGPTGSGKSTLLGAINGLVPRFSGGTLAGRVSVAGRGTDEHRARDMADLVGYVGQHPAAGFVTDTVEEEIAYGMEQLGLPPATMRKRVEETLDLMGIAELRARSLRELSGGQQQRVAIAAVLAAQPRVLVLDEPTSALDPTAAGDVLAALTHLVLDVGMTVVLAEHRLERVLQAADSVVVLPGDATARFGPPATTLPGSPVRPPLVQLAGVLGWDDVPLSVRDARRRVHAEAVEVRPPVHIAAPADTPPAVEVRGLSHSYGRIRALDDVSFTLSRGTVTTVIGRNGSGKSTLLWALQGALPGTGDVRIDGVDPRRLPPAEARRHVALVPQNAADLLYLDTVAAELAQADRESGAAPGATAALLSRLGAALDPARHPRDLSEGQRLALVLAIQLAARPAVLLLDEPTRGLDYAMKSALRGILAGLVADGITVVISSHDIEFVAAVGQRTLMLADGTVVADGPTRDVCTSSPALAPQVAKVFAPVPVLTADEVYVTARRRPVPKADV